MARRASEPARGVSEQTSYRQILHSTTLIGGATLAGLAIEVLRNKVVALLLGPTGLGLIGLLQQLMTTAAAIAGMGLPTVATRMIAHARSHDDPLGTQRAKHHVLVATVVMAVIGAAVFWWLREPAARWVLGDATRANEVGALAIGVALAAVAGALVGVLNGFRDVRALAVVQLGGALAGAVLGVGVLIAFPALGVVPYLLAGPVASLAITVVLARRLPALPRVVFVRRAWIAGVGRVLRLGAGFMASTLVVMLGHLLIRMLVQRECGAVALGLFEAAWTISMSYVGLVLTAMATDYFPRLTAALNEPATANRLANEQSEVALLLCGPALLLMMGVAPWVLELLFSGAFHEAAATLRWQMVGDVMRVVCFPMGFMLIAAGDVRRFFWSESFAIGVCLVTTALLIKPLGVEATGIGFVVMYALYLPLVYGMSRNRTGFRWSARVVTLLAGHGAAVAMIGVVSLRFEVAAQCLGLAGAALSATLSARRLRAALRADNQAA